MTTPLLGRIVHRKRGKPKNRGVGVTRKGAKRRAKFHGNQG